LKDKIDLTQDYFIARGGERDCYHHPFDATKVIKILYKRNGVFAYNGTRNQIEYKYFQFLKKAKVPFTHISKSYNYLDSNLGRGLIYEKICDYDGKISLSFLKVIRERLINEDVENFLLKELKDYLFKYNILFIDCGIDNLLCCEYEKGKYKLVIIDGLGAKRKGFKFLLYLNSKLYTKRKVEKQWKVFMKKIEKELIQREISANFK
jgi:hypothetical protein